MGNLGQLVDVRGIWSRTSGRAAWMSVEELERRCLLSAEVGAASIPTLYVPQSVINNVVLLSNGQNFGPADESGATTLPTIDVPQSVADSVVLLPNPQNFAPSDESGVTSLPTIDVPQSVADSIYLPPNPQNFLSGFSYSSSPSSSDLTPGDITTFYGSGSVNGNSVDGTGVTIAIIDENIDPNVQSDLNAFDTHWSLPSTTINEYAVDVGSSTPVNDVAGSDGNDALETDLDVEFAHAMAPGATINLYDVPTGLQLDTVSTIAAVAHVSVISMSWGYTEGSGETSDDSIFATPSGHAHITFVASSGDISNTVYYPSASPNVVSVGGTQLSSGTTGTDEAWSNSSGGASAYEAITNVQGGIAGNRFAGSGADNEYGASSRVTPDLAMFASSVSVYDQTDGGSSTPWVEDVQGTSLSAPLFSGVMALVDQGRKAYTTQADNLDGPAAGEFAIYGLHDAGDASDINDITTGTNAAAGYDTSTGLGSPNVPSFVNDLANLVTVLGTSGNDSISASISGSTLTVVTNGSSANYTDYAATSLFVDGLAGDDTISMGSSVGFSTVLIGAGGNDSITGGVGYDYLIGGSGNDSLQGSAGNDYVYGTAGNDTIGGGSGNDIVIAGLNAQSSVTGGTGTNLFMSDQGIQDTLTASGTDSGYYDHSGVTDSISGTISLL
jgi:subtilase family serine protease